MLLELVAALQSIDPTSLPLWGVLVLAAGMYPLGMMLGSQCSPCCSPCGCPVGEQLPDALVVSFSGLTKAATKIENLLSLELSSCFGGGATGTVHAPGGLPGDGGPISGVTLTSGGSGYAVLGRVAPTGLSISATGGTGAEFSISLTAAVDDCSLPYWSIAAVTVTKAGEGYADNQALTVNLGADEFELLPASLTLRTTPSEPTISATVTETSGVGVELSVTQTQVATDPDRWGVSKVAVKNGGSGYDDYQPVAFSVASGETTVSPAVAVVRVTRVAPTVVAHYYGDGTGATFAPTLTKTTVGGSDVWKVTSVAVTSGGSGYADNENVIFFSDTVGELNDADSYWKIVTNGSGVVTSLTKTTEGQFWAHNGVVSSVEVSSSGSYYGHSTSADTVVVNNGGQYYKERADIPAHVADITAAVAQEAPSAGSGATFAVTVDTNPASPTFGQVTSIEIGDGGDAYLEWSYEVNENCCITGWNGTSLYVPRLSPTSCDYSKACCDRGTVYVRYNGPSTPPTVVILGACGISFTTDEPAPYACEDFAFSGVDLFGTGQVSVQPATPETTEDEHTCPGCCNGDRSACVKEDCLAAGGSWWDVCECRPGCAVSNCPDNEYVVEVTVTLRPELVPAGEESPKVFTFTLSQENGYSEVIPGAGPLAGWGLANIPAPFGCGVFFEVYVDSTIGPVSASSLVNQCTLYGLISLPSAVSDNGQVCPIDGAEYLCGTPGGLIEPGGLGPQQLARVDAVVTVVKP